MSGNLKEHIEMVNRREEARRRGKEIDEEPIAATITYEIDKAKDEALRLAKLKVKEDKIKEWVKKNGESSQIAYTVEVKALSMAFSALSKKLSKKQLKEDMDKEVRPQERANGMLIEKKYNAKSYKDNLNEGLKCLDEAQLTELISQAIGEKSRRLIGKMKLREYDRHEVNASYRIVGTSKRIYVAAHDWSINVSPKLGGW